MARLKSGAKSIKQATEEGVVGVDSNVKEVAARHIIRNPREEFYRPKRFIFGQSIMRSIKDRKGKKRYFRDNKLGSVHRIISGWKKWGDQELELPDSIDKEKRAEYQERYHQIKQDAVDRFIEGYTAPTKRVAREQPFYTDLRALLEGGEIKNEDGSEAKDYERGVVNSALEELNTLSSDIKSEELSKEDQESITGQLDTSKNQLTKKKENLLEKFRREKEIGLLKKYSMDSFIPGLDKNVTYTEKDEEGKERTYVRYMSTLNPFEKQEAAMFITAKPDGNFDISFNAEPENYGEAYEYFMAVMYFFGSQKAKKHFQGITQKDVNFTADAFFDYGIKNNGQGPGFNKSIIFTGGNEKSRLALVEAAAKKGLWVELNNKPTSGEAVPDASNPKFKKAVEDAYAWRRRQGYSVNADGKNAAGLSAVEGEGKAPSVDVASTAKVAMAPQQPQSSQPPQVVMDTDSQASPGANK